MKIKHILLFLLIIVLTFIVLVYKNECYSPKLLFTNTIDIDSFFVEYYKHKINDSIFGYNAIVKNKKLNKIILEYSCFKIKATDNSIKYYFNKTLKDYERSNKIFGYSINNCNLLLNSKIRSFSANVKFKIQKLDSNSFKIEPSFKKNTNFFALIGSDNKIILSKRFNKSIFLINNNSSIEIYCDNYLDIDNLIKQVKLSKTTELIKNALDKNF